MSLVTVSAAKGGRVYQRKFDHDEARVRHAAGESIRSLARNYGVSEAAVGRVVNPGTNARMRLISRANIMSGTCERCGVQGITKTSRWCRTCWALEKNESVRPGELLCSRCSTWKLDDEFYRNRMERFRRGRHRLCKTCNNKARRDYRMRMKVPCPGCGQPTSPVGSSDRRTSIGFCRKCQLDRKEIMALEPTFVVLVQESEGLWREHARVAAKDKRDALTMSFNGNPPKDLIAVVSLQAFRPGHAVAVKVYDLEIE